MQSPSEVYQTTKKAFSNPRVFIMFENHQLLQRTAYSAAR